MSLFTGLADFLGYIKTQPVGNPVAWQRAQATGAEWELPPLTMPEAQADLYKRLSWVQIAIGNVASVAATTKLSVKRLEGEDEVDIPNHPFELLLDRPNPLMSRYELLEALTGFRLLTGQAFLWLNRTSDAVAPSEMWVIPTSQIEPVPDENLYLRGYMYDAGNGQPPIPLDLHEIVHFKRWNPANPFVGLSGIEALATVAIGDMSMQKWNTNFFSKDNAKPPGALAFADPIADSDWDRLKDDINRQHGGVQRRMMMLRNAGKGGVEWINMAVSQKDMEFLSSRTFNRSEIFGMLAPGLDSILAINATEANATAGKRTFIDFGVWPGLVSMAEKITNDILPSYGPNLRAEFDDIRITDKAMELAEQGAFSQVATIDEIRKRYYQLDPIGDERGVLLVAEITAGKANQPEPVQPPTSGAMPEPMLPVEPDEDDDQDGSDTPTDEDTGDDDNEMDGTKASKARTEDLARFRRWASKRRNPDPDAFKSDVLSYEDKAAVLYDILTGDADSDTMPPFTLTTGPLTPEWVTAAKAMILQLDPDDNEAEQKIRMEIEKQFERELAAALKEQGIAVTATDLNSASEAIERAAEHNPKIRDILRRRLQQSADLGVFVAVDQFSTIGLGIDWTLANQAAAQWVERYTFELVRGIEETTRQRLQTAVTEWVNNGDPLSELTKELTPTFGKRRAKLIAQTETTRAYSEGNVQAYQTSGLVTRSPKLQPPQDSHPGCRCWLVLGESADGQWVYIWKTSNDERVCPVCGPLHNTEQ